MPWEMHINDILPDVITTLDHTLTPPGLRGDARSVRLVLDYLSSVIDDLGEQSARAQGLNKVVTTADKMRNSPGYTLYLLKDAAAHSGSGAVIGYMKVGQKKLYLYDPLARLIETKPLCVLDFYVMPQYQRHGNGKLLFDHMLHEKGVEPWQLAIDGPSEKMRAFIRKNYGLDDLAQQSNNFAVSSKFFGADWNDCTRASSSGRSTLLLAQQVGRVSTHKPLTTIGTVIHGSGYNSRTESRDHRW